MSDRIGLEDFQTGAASEMGAGRDRYITEMPGSAPSQQPSFLEEGSNDQDKWAINSWKTAEWQGNKTSRDGQNPSTPEGPAAIAQLDDLFGGLY